MVKSRRVLQQRSKACPRSGPAEATYPCQIAWFWSRLPRSASSGQRTEPPTCCQYGRGFVHLLPRNPHHINGGVMKKKKKKIPDWPGAECTGPRLSRHIAAVITSGCVCTDADRPRKTARPSMYMYCLPLSSRSAVGGRPTAASGRLSRSPPGCRRRRDCSSNALVRSGAAARYSLPQPRPEQGVGLDGRFLIEEARVAIAVRQSTQPGRWTRWTWPSPRDDAY